MMWHALPPAEAKLPFFSMARGVVAGNDDFADALAEFLKVKRCLVAESARALLYLLFCFLRKRAVAGGDEILIPGYTCYSVAAAVVKAGLRVALYDLDPGTLQADLEDVRRKIGPRTLAVVGQHLLGIPSHIEGLAAIAREHGIPVVLDSAQALGEPTENPGAGADFTVFSFGRGKPLPLGSGGAMIAKDPGELDNMRPESFLDRQRMGNFLLPFLVQIFIKPRLYWILEKLPLGLGRTVYDPGFAVEAMPRAYQRIGVAVLPELARLNRHRIMIGKLYQDRFQAQAAGGAERTPAYTRYPLLVRNQSDTGLLAAHGVRRLYPLALCDLAALGKALAGAAGGTPGAREIAERLITLPTHLAVERKTAEMIIRAVEGNFQQVTAIALPKNQKTDKAG
ncbi:aminotransferase class V-fold PLP-dependent enzyme [Thiovibrio sp. JS02]